MLFAFNNMEHEQTKHTDIQTDATDWYAIHA